MNFYRYNFFLLGFLVFQIIDTNTLPVNECDGLERNLENLIEKAEALIQDSNKILKDKIQTLPEATAVNVVNMIKTTAECESQNLISYLKGNKTKEEHDMNMLTCFLQLKETAKEELAKLNNTIVVCVEQTTEIHSEKKETTVHPQWLNGNIRNEQKLANKTVSNVQDINNEKESPKDRTNAARDVFMYQNISTKFDAAKPEGTTELIQEGNTTDKTIAVDTTKKPST